MRRSGWLAIVLALMMVAAPAEAHFRAHADPDDSDDPNLRRVALRIREVAGRRRLVGKAVMFPHVNPDVEETGLRIHFDSRGGPRYDFVVKIFEDDGIIITSVLIRRGHGRVVDVPTRLDFDRSGAETFRFNFPRRLLGATRHVRWRVTAKGFDGGDAEYNIDHAPNAGWFGH